MNDLSWEERYRQAMLEWLDETTEAWTRMTDPNKIAQEVINLSRNYWDTTMKMVTASQDYYEKTWQTFLKQQEITAQANGANLLQECLNNSKQARESFTKAMEENWQKIEAGLTTTPRHSRKRDPDVSGNVVGQEHGK